MRIKDKVDRQYARQIVKLLKDGKRGELLDIGLGRGQITRMYLDMGFNVTGIDVSREFLDEDIKIDLDVADLDFEELPYTNDYFDIVCCTEVLEHMENPHNLIREISRVLKVNGEFIISTPFTSSLMQRIYFLFTGKYMRFLNKYEAGGHITPINLYLLKSELRKNNLHIEEVSYNRGFIPLLNIDVSRNWLFGDCIILKGRKE